MRNALGDTDDHDLATVLHEESEGSVAGLQLMTLFVSGQQQAAKGAARVAAVSAVSEDIEVYLLDEVLASQPPAVQEYLLRMSILSRFNASLCEAVAAEESDPDAPPGWGKSFLAWLYRANLFVIPLNGRTSFFASIICSGSFSIDACASDATR